MLGVRLYYSEVPITVLALNIDIYFNDDYGANVKVTRDYIVRANMPGVAAYHHQLVVGAEGRIPEDEIECRLSGPHPRGTSLIPHKFGNESQGWHCIQEFGPSLPYKFFFPFLPLFAMVRGQGRDAVPRSYFRTCMVVKGRVEATYYDDFNREKMFFLRTTRNPIIEATFHLHFRTTKRPRYVNAWRVENNAVYKENFMTDSNADSETWTVTVQNLRNVTIYITWDF